MDYACAGQLRREREPCPELLSGDYGVGLTDRVPDHHRPYQ